MRELEQTGEDPAGHLDVMTARPGGGGERLGTLTLPHPAPEMRDTVIRRGWPHRFSGPDRRFANRALTKALREREKIRQAGWFS